MTIPNRQIGQDPQSQLLWQISKQLDYLTKVISKGITYPTTTTTTTVAPTTTTTTSSSTTTTTTTANP